MRENKEEKPLLGSLFRVSFLCAPLGGGESSSAGSPRNATALAGEAMAGGSPWEEKGCVWRKEKGHRRGHSWAGGRVRAKGNVGLLTMQMGVTVQTPGCSNSTPGEPEGNHLKFKDKMDRGGGSGHSI